MAERPQRPVGRVILTYSRSFQALAAIRSLGRRGIEVIAGDEYSVTPGALSRYTTHHFTYPSPGTEPEAFIETLLDVAREHTPADDRPYVLMPVHRETTLVAQAMERFDDRIAVPVASYASIDIARHKSRLARFAERHEVPVPPTWLPRSRRELDQQVPEMGFPVFVKVPCGAAGHGIARVEAPEALGEVWQTLVRDHGLSGDDLPMVQGSVEGDDYCVTALFDRGEARAMMTYRNVLNWPPESGSGVVRETVEAPRAELLAQRLLGALDWHGIAQVDFRWSGDEGDEPRLLEVNPRFFGGMAQAVESGVDYPWLLFRVAMGWNVEPPVAALDTRTEEPFTGLLATLREIASDDGRLGKLRQAWERAKDDVKIGRRWHAVQAIVDGLEQTLDVDARVERARALIEDNADNVSELFDEEDPLPVLGLIYPVSIFLRHGKVSAALLSGLERPAADG